MEFTGLARPLEQSSIGSVLDSLSINEATLWSVIEVETAGVGFLANRQPAMLFERHKFSMKTEGVYDTKFPDISDPVWGGYGKDGVHQYDRLYIAIELNKSAALESASWGLGQVMGENWKSLGYADVETFVGGMIDGEGQQLEALARFIIKNGLSTKLQQRDWAGFARRYNGPGYAENGYDVKLAQHYQQLATATPRDLRTRAMQLYLTYLSVKNPEFNPNGVDGFMGKRTKNALTAYQTKKSLSVTGLPDDATYQSILTDIDLL